MASTSYMSKKKGGEELGVLENIEILKKERIY
jgi:hypothetical protein